MSLFFAVILSIWSVMNLYVGFRTWSLVRGHVPVAVHVLVLLVLWVAYPAGRMLDGRGAGWPARALEWLGAQWMGVLFLLVLALLVADLVTGFGLWRRAALPARFAALGVAGVLAAIAFVQGSRAPVVTPHEVALPGLPEERDGTTVAVVSDLHVGALLGERWLAARIAQIEALSPDLVLVVGDLVDGNADHVESVLPVLSRLKAPLGVFAVTGNHEYYAGVEASRKVLRDAGFTVLRDEAALAAPGLVIAGIDDLTARRQFGTNGHDPIERALAGRPAGATILLSHTPWRAEDAARHGAGLMLSGHTHDGQIWPFKYFEQHLFPLMSGRYDIGGMPAIVGRGTGTWGPRMRLWRRAEILLITLRAPGGAPPA